MIDKVMKKWIVVLVSCWTLSSVGGFKSGAPVSMCADMVPHHRGTSPQTVPPEYTISVNPLDVNNGLFKVKIDSVKEPFAGFLLEARTRPDGDAMGTFTKHPDDVKTLNCGRTEASALTHSNNTKRVTTEADWLSPAEYDGDITFVATVVANYSTYWMGVKSTPVRVVKRAVPGGAPSTNTKFQGIYDGCGNKKKCMGDTDDCLASRDCQTVLTVTNGGDRYIFEMMALKSKYVAVGLSDDAKMGGDNVVECVHEDSDSNSIRAYRSWNIPNMKQNRRAENEQTGYKLEEGSYSDGDIFCRVSMNIETEVEDVKFNLERNAYYLLLAAGKSLKDSSVGFHDVAYKASKDKQLLSETKDKKPHDPIYDGCNLEKNCFGSPDGCIESESCDALSTVLVEGTKYIFELKGKSNGYVALGLSDDDKMGGDSVVECVHEQGNKISVYRSWNKPGEKANTRRKINQDTINLLNSSYVDGIIYCKYSQSMKSTVEEKVFDLVNDKYFLLIAAGSGLKENGVGFHDILFTSSGQKRALSDIGAFTAASKLLIRLHGSFMVAAWIGCASIGIILARYFKQTWVGSSLCNKDLWFAWHRFFMFLAWALTIAGFILIFVELGEWVGPNSQIHAILGCITTLLAFVQPIGAAFRPHPAARKRPLFNWLHWLVGNSAHILAIVTIFFAVPLNKAELPSWLDWILVSFVVIYVTMHVLLSFAGFRKLMLFLHIVSTTAITGSIIIIIALAPIEAQWNSLQDKFMPT